MREFDLTWRGKQKLGKIIIEDERIVDLIKLKLELKDEVLIKPSYAVICSSNEKVNNKVCLRGFAFIKT